MLILYSITLSNIYSSKGFLVEPLVPLTYRITSFANKDTLTSFLFDFLSYFISLAKTSSTMLNNRKNQHLFLTPT